MTIEEMEQLYVMLSVFKRHARDMWGFGEPIQEAITVARAGVGELLYRAMSES